MTILLTTEVLQQLIETNGLNVIRKTQKERDNYNYFITPVSRIRFFNARIKARTQKFMVLEFDKAYNLSLLHLLQYISKTLIYQVKIRFPDIFENEYPIYIEHENTFTVRCFLPNTKGKYHITCEDNGLQEQFTLPNIHVIIKQIDVDIRNLWKNNNNLGFNLEVKHISW